jgi:uncharacterized protein (UPF0335 family)
VDERDASLTEGAQKIEGRLQNTRALPHAPFDQNCSRQEYTMATSAAVQEAPATRFAKDQLKAIIERIERLEEEKKTISDDIRDVYAEGKGNGFDVKALRQIIRLRKQDPNERAEAETILETYMQALGMI